MKMMDENDRGVVPPVKNTAQELNRRDFLTTLSSAVAATPSISLPTLSISSIARGAFGQPSE